MQNTFKQVNEIIDTLEIIVKGDAQVAQIEKDILLERMRKLYVQLMELAVTAEEETVVPDMFAEEPVVEEKMEEIEQEEQKEEEVKVEQEVPAQEPEVVEPEPEEVTVKEEPVAEIVEEPVVVEPKVEEPQQPVVEEKIEQPIKEVKAEQPAEKKVEVESLPSDEDDLLQFIPQNNPKPEPQPQPQKPIAQAQAQPQRSLNDLFNEQKDHSLSAQYQHAKVVDLTKAISINDKFTYIKELFNNKGEEFSAAIQSLNQCTTIDEAFDCLEVLKKKYFWDSTSTAYLSLCDLLRRKF